MTAKNIKSKSIEGDPYYTPDWVVGLFIDYVLPAFDPMLLQYVPTILEPGAGQGAFVKRLRRKFPEGIIHAVDIDPKVGPWPEANESITGDFLKWGMTPLPKGEKYDFAAGNPPYTFAQDFIDKTSKLCDRTIFLLRQGFMSSADRQPFFTTKPASDVFILPQRPAFRGSKSTDTADYCFICWDWRHPQTHTKLHWLPLLSKEERGRGKPALVMPKIMDATP